MLRVGEAGTRTNASYEARLDEDDEDGCTFLSKSDEAYWLLPELVQEMLPIELSPADESLTCIGLTVVSGVWNPAGTLR